MSAELVLEVFNISRNSRVTSNQVPKLKLDCAPVMAVSTDPRQSPGHEVLDCYTCYNEKGWRGYDRVVHGNYEIFSGTGLFEGFFTIGLDSCLENFFACYKDTHVQKRHTHTHTHTCSCAYQLMRESVLAFFSSKDKRSKECRVVSRRKTHVPG